MRNPLARIVAAASSLVAAIAISPTPAHAYWVQCQGECTAGPVWSNTPGNWIRVQINNPWSIDPRWCSWTVRDSDNGALVGSGTAWDEESYSHQIDGLYNRYTLFISNSACNGRISNE